MAIDLSSYAGQYPQAVLDAAKAILDAKPEQIQQNLGPDGQFDLKTFINGTVGWWTENGHQAANSDELKLVSPLFDSLGYGVNPAAVPTPTTTGPAEQQIWNRVGDQYIAPGFADDAANKAAATGIVGGINRSLDDAIATNAQLTTGSFDAAGYLKLNPDVAAQIAKDVAAGYYPDMAAGAKAHYEKYGKAEGRYAPVVTRLQEENRNADDTAARLAASAAAAAQTRLAALDQRKVEMTAALEQSQADRSGALDKQTAQLREGLAQLETERKAALQQLTTARTAAAEGQVTGINQGLQAERDRITAANATQGYVGGSSMQDSALARATIGARQGAAQAMGSANVANASDSRALGDEIAGTRFGITGNDATSRRGIAEDTAAGRFNLADTLSGARVGVSDTLANQTQSATDAGTKMRATYFDNDFGRRLQAALTGANLGTTRLNLLDLPNQIGSANLNRSLGWMNNFAGTNAPPSSSAFLTTPSTVGADIAGLGTGLAKSGINIGNSIGWGNIFGTPAAGTPAANAGRPGYDASGFPKD